MTSYDSWVDSYRINPPIGKVYEWGAKAKVKQTGTGRTDDFITLREHWGKTEKEARSKATAEANEWIARQGGSED